MLFTREIFFEIRINQLKKGSVFWYLLVMSPSRAGSSQGSSWTIFSSARLGLWPFPSSSEISLLRLGKLTSLSKGRSRNHGTNSLLQINCIFLLLHYYRSFFCSSHIHKEPSLVCLLIELQAHFCIEWNCSQGWAYCTHCTAIYLLATHKSI